jgi:hypothetical protein
VYCFGSHQSRAHRGSVGHGCYWIDVQQQHDVQQQPVGQQWPDGGVEASVQVLKAA